MTLAQVQPGTAPKPLAAAATRGLTVLLPGFGYGPDKPLLYYAAKVARQKGRTVTALRYTALAARDTPEARAQDSLPGALADAEAQILPGFDRYVLVAKSFGTLVAGLWAARRPKAAVTLLQLTPLPQGYETVYRGVPAFHATGTADPLSGPEFRRRLAADPAIELLVVPGGNHSLDTPPDYAAGLQALQTLVALYRARL